MNEEEEWRWGWTPPTSASRKLGEPPAMPLPPRARDEEVAYDFEVLPRKQLTLPEVEEALEALGATELEVRTAVATRQHLTLCPHRHHHHR